MSNTVCPLCKNKCETVSASKVYGTVKKHFQKHVKAKEYGFCSNPECDIIYFSADEDNNEMYFHRDFEEILK